MFSKLYRLLVIPLSLITSEVAVAQMPDCLSGICIKDVKTKNEFISEGFTHELDLCRRRNIYRKNDGDMSFFVMTESSEDRSRTPDKIFELHRVIYIEPIHMDGSMGATEKELNRLKEIVVDKYGQPLKVFGGRSDYKLRYQDSFEHFSKVNKEVNIHHPPKESRFVIAQIFEDRTYYTANIDRFSYCEEQKKKKLTGSIIPD